MNATAMPTSNISRLGSAVQTRRQQLGLRQDQLAELADCSRLTIIRLENGSGNIRLDKLLSILSVLGLQLTIQPGAKGLVIGA